MGQIKLQVLAIKKNLYPVTGVSLFLMLYFMLDGLILFRISDFHSVRYL